MIIVTGANGFIGRALRAELLRRGRAARFLSRRPLEGYINIGTFDDISRLRSVLNRADAVIHLAGMTSLPRMSDSAAYKVLRSANVEVTSILARAAIAAGVRRFVFVSSVKVHGEETPMGHPFHHNDPPRPQDAYARTKWEAEEVVRALNRPGTFELVVVRPPLVYGPGVKGNFASMVRAVLKGVPLPVGFVDNKRSLVAVGNLVDLLIRCLDDPKAAGGTFLVRDGLDLSTRELIARIATAGGRHPRVFPVPSAFMRLAASLVGRTGLVRPLLGSLQVDDSETRQRLDWLPPVGVDKAIAETVCDFLEARH